jgi:hypothetical protein
MHIPGTANRTEPFRAVEIGRRAVAEHLAQRGRQILGVAGTALAMPVRSR